MGKSQEKEDFIIGFTGSRNGMTGYQLGFVEGLIQELHEYKEIIGIHGGCVGADAEFNEICRQIGIKTEMYPGVYDRDQQNESQIGDMEVDVIHIGIHSSRSRDIVNRCDLLVACPSTAIYSGRSGTWYTINYAKRVEKEIVLVTPFGE